MSTLTAPAESLEALAPRVSRFFGVASVEFVKARSGVWTVVEGGEDLPGYRVVRRRWFYILEAVGRSK